MELVALLGRLDERGRYDVAEEARVLFGLVDLSFHDPALLTDALEELLPKPDQLPQLLRVVERFAAVDDGAVAADLRAWSLRCAERLGLEGQLKERRGEAKEYAESVKAAGLAQERGAPPGGSWVSIQIRLHPSSGPGQRRAYEVGDDDGKGDQRQPAAPPTEGEPEPGPLAPAGLYAPGAVRSAAARPARAIGVRGVRALPAARGLSRALRPLRRSVPSRTSFCVDETATAEWIAETGLPDVVLRPRPERWLSVALIVDDGPSMVLWQQLAAEVRGLLERQGAFRSVRTYGLDSAQDAAPVLRARPYAPGAPRRTARQLTDTSGRTVMLVLSDGVGPGWRGGAIPRLLRRWARHSPVAVLQPLPARMWPERGMPTQRLLVDAGGREGSPGRALSVRHPVLPRGLVSYDGKTPVPVLELAEGELGAWAALTGTGGSGAPLPVMLLDGAEKPVAARATAHVPEPTAEERLRRFRGAASPEAQRLAGALATVHPLTLPVMRLIHQAGAGRGERFHPAQLAEVFLGGLLRRRGRAAGGVRRSIRGSRICCCDAVRTSDALAARRRRSPSACSAPPGQRPPDFRARVAGDHGDAGASGEEDRPFARRRSPGDLLSAGLAGCSGEGPDDSGAARHGVRGELARPMRPAGLRPPVSRSQFGSTCASGSAAGGDGGGAADRGGSGGLPKSVRASSVALNAAH
ncbi:hypothetical protein SANTM175S_07150 [Streptomyces antimycoticus]